MVNFENKKQITDGRGVGLLVDCFEEWRLLAYDDVR